MQKFFKSFKYAIEGIIHCFLTERNLKIHTFIAGIVIIAGLVTGLAAVEWLIISLFISGVIALELMNTAIERTIDLIITTPHPLAKQAKDLAAGAVLVLAVASAVAGLYIFLPKWLSLIS